MLDSRERRGSAKQRKMSSAQMASRAAFQPEDTGIWNVKMEEKVVFQPQPLGPQQAVPGQGATQRDVPGGNGGA